MNALDFARRHFGIFKQKGNEIIPVYCVYCGGGAKRDKYTFALNVENNTFNCKRGSCGKQGHFTELCKDFGEETIRDKSYHVYNKPEKQYKKPASKMETASERVESYLKLRGFDKDVWEKRGVCESNGNIAMPYYENGELVMIKFRKPEKYNGSGMKSWREAGGKAVLWGMDLCNPESPLVIVEGEMDALALDQVGIENVVSVPSGAEDLTWIELCWEWLEKFNQIIIWGDNDDCGKKMVRNVVSRLGDWRCYIVDCEHKDANIALKKEGAVSTAAYVFNANPVPVSGLIELADVVPVDTTKIERVGSGIKIVDQSVGGFQMGELSVWTGKSGQGKSTFLGQLLLESIESNMKVCAYSGELRAERFQYWINLQAAGLKNIKFNKDEFRNKNIPFVSDDVTRKIKEWYRGKFWLYDNNMVGENCDDMGIIKIFTIAARKYGCKVFLVDNLMTSKYATGKSDSDFYRAQSNFVGELVHFAKTYNVHVHLVAHPKKTKDKLGKEDISGTGDIANRADNVFSICRAEELPLTSVLTVLKNRSEGVQDLVVNLQYDPQSKRFWHEFDKKGESWKYSWEEDAKKEKDPYTYYEEVRLIDSES